MKWNGKFFFGIIHFIFSIIEIWNIALKYNVFWEIYWKLLSQKKC